jgi:hypothetical protein
MSRNPLQEIKTMLIQRPRCVAEAGDIANEQILTLAKDLEVDSSRLVGVFTKCDQSQEPETVRLSHTDGQLSKAKE